MKFDSILEKITMKRTMRKHVMVPCNLLKSLIYHHDNHDNHDFGEKLLNIFYRAFYSHRLPKFLTCVCFTYIYIMVLMVLMVII